MKPNNHPPRFLLLTAETEDPRLVEYQLKADYPRALVTTVFDEESTIGRLDDGFDVGFLDYLQPGDINTDLLVKLQECDPELPLIVLSSEISSDLAESLISHGVHDFINKSNGVDKRLKFSVQRALDHRRLSMKSQTLNDIENLRSHQMNVVNEVGRRLSTLFDTQEIASTFVDLLVKQLGYEAVSLLLLDKNQEDLILYAVGGKHAPTITPNLRQPKDIGLPGEVFKTLKSYMGNRPAPDECSELCVPIVKEDICIGVVYIEEPQKDAFRDSDLQALETVARQLAISFFNANLFSEIQQRAVELGMLHKASQDIGASLDMNYICRAVHHGAISLLPTDFFWIVLSVKEVAPLRTLYSHSRVTPDHAWAPPTASRLIERLLSSPTGYTLTEGNGLGSDDHPIKSCAVAPLRMGEGLEGFIASGALTPERYHPSDVQLLSTLAGHAASAIQNARLYSRVEHFQSEVVNSLVEAVEMKSSFTLGHSSRVREVAVELGTRLGLPLNQLQILERGAYLHDVGKIGIPDAILEKNGKLSNQEFDVIKTHPLRGQRILSHSPAMENLIPVVKYHHERWDGGGYPEGLSGEGIPIMARLVAVADAFDAMNSPRPYRDAFPMENVLEELQNNAGRQHDEEIVNHLIKMVKEPDSRIERTILRRYERKI